MIGRKKGICAGSTKKMENNKIFCFGSLIVLLPVLVYSLYSLIFTHPKQAAFINSQEHFLKREYSEVVSGLSDYKVDQMPRVVQYELAQSYIINESLTEDQKENVRNTITLNRILFTINIGFILEGRCKRSSRYRAGT